MNLNNQWPSSQVLNLRAQGLLLNQSNIFNFCEGKKVTALIEKLNMFTSLSLMGFLPLLLHDYLCSVKQNGFPFDSC